MSVAQRRDVFNLVSPFVFLGGLGLALALNAYAALRLSFSKEDGAIVSTVRLSMKLLNISVAAMSSLLLFTLVGYIFLEKPHPSLGERDPRGLPKKEPLGKSAESGAVK